MKSVEKFRGTEDVDTESNTIVLAVEVEHKRSKRSFPDTLLVMDKTNLKKTLKIMTVFSLCHLSGVYFIGTFVVDIFEPTNISNLFLVLVSGSSELIFSFFQTVIADKVGR